MRAHLIVLVGHGVRGVGAGPGPRQEDGHLAEEVLPLRRRVEHRRRATEGSLREVVIEEMESPNLRTVQERDDASEIYGCIHTLHDKEFVS